MKNLKKVKKKINKTFLKNIKCKNKMNKMMNYKVTLTKINKIFSNIPMKTKKIIVIVKQKNKVAMNLMMMIKVIMII